MENGAGFTTSSSSKQHFQEDLDIFDFAIEKEDMLTLNSLMGRVSVQ